MLKVYKYMGFICIQLVIQIENYAVKVITLT